MKARYASLLSRPVSWPKGTAVIYKLVAPEVVFTGCTLSEGSVSVRDAFREHGSHLKLEVLARCKEKDAKAWLAGKEPRLGQFADAADEAAAMSQAWDHVAGVLAA